jgi:hypothetical protein
MDIPEGAEDGLLILQRTSTFGIRKILHWILNITFQDKYPDWRLQFLPLVADSEIDKFIKGKIQKINFIRKAIPADIADAYDTGHDEVRGTMELVIRANKGSTLPMHNFISNIFKTKKQKDFWRWRMITDLRTIISKQMSKLGAQSER